MQLLKDGHMRIFLLFICFGMILLSGVDAASAKADAVAPTTTDAAVAQAPGAGVSLAAIPDADAATLEPAIPGDVVNLVKNPGIEEGRKDWINNNLAYHKERAETFIFKVDTTQAFAGSKCLYMSSKSNKFSGYWEQHIPVEAGKHYLFQMRARVNNSSLLVLLWGGMPGGKKFDERIAVSSSAADYLIPLYLRPEYTTELGGGWELVNREFIVPEGMNTLLLSFGIFFAGGYILFDEISLYQVELKNLPVRLKVAIPGRKIKSLKVNLQRTEGDIIFERNFDAPVATFDEVIPGTAADRAYAAEINFDDGSKKILFCPSKNQKME